MNYLILGRNPALSLAEIKTVYKELNIVIEKNVVLIDEDLDIKKSVARLGGVIKGGKIIGKLNNSDKETIKRRVIEYVSKLLEDGMLKKEKKIFLDLVFIAPKTNWIEVLQKNGNGIKKILKEEGIASRWVVSKEDENLPSIVVGENKLFIENNGLELNIMEIDNELYLGETIAVQDYMKYSRLDYGRPVRDARSGMLPVKLAKIMINLSGAKIGETLLDPFCGSGTILQEAVLLGYKKIIGSDFSKVAMENSEKNLKWLEEKYLKHIKNTNMSFEDGLDVKLVHVSAEKLSGAIKNETIGAIITEPYLGPPIRPGVPLDIQEVIKNLSRLYLKAFSQFKTILKNNGVIVMIWPIFKTEEGYKHIPIMEEIEEMGFKKVELLTSSLMGFAEKEFGKSVISKRKTIIYSRPDQYVRREIVKFFKHGKVIPKWH